MNSDTETKLKCAESLAGARGMREMRIALVGLPPGSSGIATYTRGLATGLARRHHEVLLVCFGEADPRLPEGVEQIVLPNLPQDIVRAHAFPLRSFQRVSRRVLEVVQPRHPDVIHMTLPPAGASITQASPAVATVWFTPHNLIGRVRTASQFAPPRLHQKVLHLSEHRRRFLADDRCFRGCRRLVALTRAAERDMAAQGFPVRRIPAGIALPEFGPPSVDETAAPRVVFAANDVEDVRKGLPFLLAALPTVRRARSGRPFVVDLVGNHSVRLPQLLRDQGLSDVCHLHGFLTGEPYWRIVRGGSLFVSASLYEEWGYAVVEAMAAGLPVVGFHHQANDDIVSPGAGILVAPGDTKALGEAIARLLEDADRRRKMSAEARERVHAEYAWDAILPQLESVYRDAASSPTR